VLLTEIIRSGSRTHTVRRNGAARVFCAWHNHHNSGTTHGHKIVTTTHAVLRVVESNKKLLKSSPFHTVYAGGSVATGVDKEGLFVKGEANEMPSTITVDGIDGYRWVIYPIDSILLPFAPSPDLCS
jgi:hypothetical protein